MDSMRSPHLIHSNFSIFARATRSIFSVSTGDDAVSEGLIILRLQVGRRDMTIKAKCICNHYSPGLATLRDPALRQALGAYMRAQELPGGGCADWIYDELFLNRSGKLFDYRGCELPIDAERQRERFERIFGEDEARSMLRVLACADRKPKYRLQLRCVFPVMMIWFATRIHLSRTTGLCTAP